jgi:predicted ATPase
VKLLRQAYTKAKLLMVSKRSLVLLSMLQSMGCATRVILVPDGQPVMLAEPVKARIYAFDSSGKLVPSSNRVVLPAGWYALPRK